MKRRQTDQIKNEAKHVIFIQRTLKLTPSPIRRPTIASKPFVNANSFSSLKSIKKLDNGSCFKYHDQIYCLN